MKSITSIDPNEQFGLLLQGPPKTGKTELLCLFPKPWIANADSNLSGFARRCKEQGFTSDMVYSDIMRDDNGKALVDKDGRPDSDLVWARFLKETSAAIADPNIKTLGFDSVTTIAMAAIAFIMSDRVKRTGKGTKDQTEIQDWNTHQNLWKMLIMRLRTTGKMVVFLAHEEGMKDEISGGILKWAVNIPGGKLQAVFGGFFSDVWRTEVDEVKKDGVMKTEYKVRTKPNSRLDLGGSIVTPDSTFTRSDSLVEQRALIYKLLNYTEPNVS